MSAYYDLYQSPPDENGESVCLHARILPRGTISADKFRELVAKATGFSPAILDGTLQAVTDELYSWLSEGWTVEVGELGYFSVSLQGPPVMHKKDVNLRLGRKFRNRFNTMELERKASPYVSRSLMGEEERKEKLLLHLDKYGCITRADYESITGLVKHRAVSDLNRYLAEGMIRKYGSGKTVVYLKP